MIRRSGGTYFVKKHFSGALSSNGIENANGTSFQTPKPNHENAPIELLLVYGQLIKY